MPEDPALRARRSVAFLLALGGLKVQKRTGWVLCGVRLPESVADHSLRVAIACLLAAPHAGADAARAALVGLAHDAAEAVTGDIVPHDTQYSKDDKQRLEAAAMAGLTATLAPHVQQDALGELWREYEAGASAAGTAEGRLAKSVDKMEMCLQALEYERAQPFLDLSQFYESVQGRLPPGSEAAYWFDEVLRLRREMLEERRTAPLHMLRLRAQSLLRSLVDSSLLAFATGLGLGVALAMAARMRR